MATASFWYLLSFCMKLCKTFAGANGTYLGGLRTLGLYARIQALKLQGCIVETNGYDEVAMVAANSESSCTDAKEAEYCISALQGGFLTCDDDFCESCGRRSHECDKTCGFCSVRRRQLQIAMPACSLQSFLDQVAELNTVCLIAPRTPELTD